MNDRTMYSLVFRNRLPRNVDKFAELIKEAIPYTMEVSGFNNLEIDKYMSKILSRNMRKQRIRATKRRGRVPRNIMAIPIKRRTKRHTPFR